MCELRESVMSACEDPLYGHLLTGPTHLTLSSFACSNTTLTHCTHSFNPPSSHNFSFRSGNANGCTNSSTTTSDCSSSSQLKFNYSSTTTVSFTSCLFDSCTASSSGGGLSLSNCHATLTQCNFTDCTASSYYGGGLYVEKSTYLSISYSYFKSCTAKNGGAIEWSITGAPSSGTGFNTVLFCSNTATSNYGYDVYLYASSSYSSYLTSYTSSLFTDCYSYNTAVTNTVHSGTSTSFSLTTQSSCDTSVLSTSASSDTETGSTSDSQSIQFDLSTDAVIYVSSSSSTSSTSTTSCGASTTTACSSLSIAAALVSSTTTMRHTRQTRLLHLSHSLLLPVSYSLPSLPLLAQPQSIPSLHHQGVHSLQMLSF